MRISLFPSPSMSIGIHEVSLSSNILIKDKIKSAAKLSKPSDSTQAAIKAVEAPQRVDTRFASSTPSSQGSPGIGSGSQPPISIIPFPFASYAQ